MRTIGRIPAAAGGAALPRPRRLPRAVTLDSSVAVTDPDTLQALERGGLSISRLLGPALGLTREVDNRGLFSVPALATVRDTVKQQIADEPKTSPDPYVAAMAKIEGHQPEIQSEIHRR